MFIWDMASSPRRHPVPARRECAICGAAFTAVRSDARFCSSRCRKRWAREPVNLAPVDCWDQEHDQDEGEPDSVFRRNAMNYQLDEAERLAKEFALLRPGTEPHEISKKTLRGVRKVARAWAALLKELRARQRG